MEIWSSLFLAYAYHLTLVVCDSLQTGFACHSPIHPTSVSQMRKEFLNELKPYLFLATEMSLLMASQLRHSCLLSRYSLKPLPVAAFTSNKYILGCRNKSDIAESKPEKKSFFKRFFGPESSVASENFKSRWLVAIPAFATHMCIGAPYAWSAMSWPLTREHGFVTSAASDWTLAETTLPLSIVFVMHGIIAAAAGKWQMKVGPRAAIATAAACFGGGLLIGSLGISTHNLLMIYFGYGFLGGTGLGLAYTPPVQALINWFPDKKGVASGLTIAGFGSGALVFEPIISRLREKFMVLPEYLGTQDQIHTVTQDGKLFADIAGQLKEVVSATQADLLLLPYEGLKEGLYLVGSGDSGNTAALATIGLAYFGIMFASALAMRLPAPGYSPAGYVPPTNTLSSGSGPQGNVTVDNVMKTPQFYLMASVLFCVATGGMGMFSVAKPMISDVFSSALPLIVTASFGSTFLLLLAAGNLGGRLGWSAFSDKFGRRSTFFLIAIGSLPLYLSVPYLVDSVVTTQSQLPLFAFCASTALAISFYGGAYAALPAYEADLFGSKYVGAIHGRFLLASSAASLAGPSILLTLRKYAEQNAITDLLSKCDPAAFKERFGQDISNSQALIDAKTVTINKMMEIMPTGTMDPTPYLYNNTMYTMAGLMAMAALCNYLLKAVDQKHFEQVTNGNKK
eukprot:gene17685-19451_t